MEYYYKTVDIFVEINGDLLIIPHGKEERFGGTTGIDIVHYLAASYTDEELEKTINLAFDECYSKTPDIDPKSSVIERYLGIKGYGKATKGKKSITISWWSGKGFEIEPWKKMDKPPKGHYVGIKDQIIKLNSNTKPGEMAEAIKKAISIATI
jgi:hypothetical protein